MKKILLSTLLLITSFNINAESLREGVHYQVISEKASPYAKVTEYFSFYCTHCKSFEPLAKVLDQRANNGDYEFIKSHVDFMKSAPQKTQELLTRALIAARHLETPKVLDEIFNTIHNKKETINGQSDVLKIFDENGISALKAKSLMYSDKATERLNSMKKSQDILTHARILEGVPTFIINDKYKILPQGFKANSTEEFFRKLDSAISILSKNR